MKLGIKFRITLLFTGLVALIMAIVCWAVFYISTENRKAIIKTRLKNRAVTTARLLSRSEVFTHELVARIDSFTTISLKNKIVRAYDYNLNLVYNYSDVPNESLVIDDARLHKALTGQVVYFRVHDKDVVACAYIRNNVKLIMVAAAQDVEGASNLNALKRILWISFLGGVAIAFIGGFIFSKQLLHPIKKIVADVNDISTHNLSRRLETGKIKDEWYSLTDTLNQLLNRIQEGFELQKRFIANASHELSTPLTSISSQLQVILQKERSASEYLAVLESVLQDAKQMNKLTQSLLEMAKASGDKGGIEINSLRIDELLMRLPYEVSRINKGFSVKLNFVQMPEDEKNLLVFGNEELLFTAIKNVVVNACKYSMDGIADVTLTYEGDALIIQIKDTGPGIDMAEAEMIFEPFYRHANNKAPGFGLGLPLAKRIIKFHNGAIHLVASSSTGSCFQIQLAPAARLII